MPEGGDLGQIPPDCVVYRAVKLIDLKPDGAPQSGCFSDLADADGSKDYMSVYFADEMAANEVSVKDLAAHWGERYAIVEFTAADLAAEGEAVWRDPDGEFPGHGACKRADGSKRTVGQKRRIAKLARRSEA